MALAQVTRARSPKIKRIGLTSASNTDFVESTELYDTVVNYDAIDDLDASVTLVVVDFAGNGKNLTAIHNHFADNLKYSCLVGATHWNAREGSENMAGPAPILFFAPDHIVAMTDELGPKGFTMEVGKAWGSFIAEASNWVDVLPRSGGEAIRDTYATLLAGKASPGDGFILSL